MGNLVVKVSTNKIKEMKEYYQKSLKSPSPPYTAFSAKVGACTITAYQSGKVMFQGTGAEVEANKWGKVDPSQAKASTASATLPNGFADWSVIGSDEVGTGDYFGPLTVVAAYVPKDKLALVKELGVKDSKDLKDPQIVAIAKELIHVIPYSLLVLPNDKYNEIQAKGYSQGKIKALLHNRALRNVLQKIAPVKPDAILIDQFAEKNIYYRHIQTEKEIVRENVYFSTKAEGLHLSVAAASIIARYAFLKHWDELSEKAGIILPKGAGNKVDEAGAKLIRKHGEEALWQFAKVHFANTQKAKNLLYKKR